nr:hypothetical protein CFP56_19578 [Quercus suber]
MWYCVKHSLQRSRQTPYQRGLYESLFADLEEEYPTLWSSSGAIPAVAPSGRLNRLKWRLLKRWFSPEKTIDKRLYSSLDLGGDTSDLGAWATFKRYLLRHWLPDIQNDHPYPEDDGVAQAEMGNSRISMQSTVQTAGSIGQLAKMSTPIAVADAEPGAIQQISLYGLRPLDSTVRRMSSGSRHSDDRPSSRGSSGVMIEERNLSDSETDAEELVDIDSHEAT